MMRTLTKVGLAAVVTVGFMFLSGRAESPVAFAQDADDQLLAAYVPPHLLTDPRADQAAPVQARSDASGHDWMAIRRPSLEVRRWTQFESEFGIRDRSQSGIKGTLQDAKYILDQSVFTVDNFVNDLEDVLEIEYRPNGSVPTAGPPTRHYFSPLHDIWENSRLKSEVDLDVNGRAFIGVIFQFPFGR